MEQNNNNQTPEIVDPTSEASTQPLEASKPQPITVKDLRNNYIHLPNVFFSRKLRPMQFGMMVLGFLRTHRFGTPGEATTPVLGLIFTLDLSPVEIAVFSYLAHDPKATFKHISRQRGIDRSLVSRSIDELMALGLVVPNEDGVCWDVVTLEEIEKSMEPTL